MKWVKAQNGEVPPNAQTGGQESHELPGSIMKWVKAQNGEVPPNAQTGGQESHELPGSIMKWVKAQNGEVPPNAQTGGQESHELPGSIMKWVKAQNGEVPPNAQIGGQDISHETIYLARTMFEGALIPGKLVPSYHCTFLSWGGKEYRMYEYEVLCDGPKNWMKTGNSNIPLTAFPGGRTVDDEVLFIGRATHNGFMTPGKVQASRACLIITFNGFEVEYKDYEILCI